MCFKFFVYITLYLLLSGILIGGEGGPGRERVTPSLNKQRASNAFYNSIHFQKLSASRYLPIFNIPGIGDWSSSRTVVVLDGVPYYGYPFGMRSIDLLPVDLVTVDEIHARWRIGAGAGGPVPGGMIDIKRSAIPDSLSVGVRLFTGSETGDPLVHIFTRPERSHINKNKVGPSFAGSISNRINRWSYRVSGGGFFYFTTGSINDVTINRYNREIANRQNRQVKAAAEAAYAIDDDRSVELYAAGINLFGWEMSPFTSLFNHYTNVSTMGRLRYRDDGRRISLTLARDESLVWTKPLHGTLPGALRTEIWNLYTQIERSVSSRLRITLFGDIGIFNATNLDEDKTGRQYFLAQSVSSVQWGGGAAIGYERGRFANRTAVRVDSRLDHTGELSADTGFRIDLGSSHVVKASAATSVYFPEYLERHGIFRTTREIQSAQETFTVTGNGGLQPERVYETSAGYVYAVSNARLTAELFGRWTDNPIKHSVQRAYRPSSTRDILRSLTYQNAGARFVPGGTVQIAVSPASFLNITTEHQYLDNSDIRSLSRYKNITALEFLLPLGALLDVTVSHTGKTFWREYVLSPEQDEYLGEGYNGIVPAATVFDVGVSYRFERFYFAKGLEVRLEAQNLINERLRRIPFGNLIDRAVFVYASFGL
jgi:hypothetical protein